MTQPGKWIRRGVLIAVSLMAAMGAQARSFDDIKKEIGRAHV